MNARAALGHFSGAALVARGDEVMLSAGYGMANLATNTKNSPETVFRVASLTKQFTAMAVMILQERGALRTSDRVADRLDGAPAAWGAITIKHLLTHTSGITDYESELELGSPAYDRFMSEPNAAARILESAKTKPLRFEPGSKFEYSNTGYVVLGFVIERVAGVPLDEFFKREIFDPLGMTRTAHDREGLVIADRAVGNELAGEFTFPRFFAGFSMEKDFATAPAMRIDPPQADAALVTTTTDLLRWDRALRDGKLIGAASMAEMFTPMHEGYAYGWFAEGTPGARHMHHTGVLPGFVSRIDRFPDEQLVVIALGNTDQSVDRIASDLAAICKGKPVTMPKKRTIIELRPDEYRPLLGDYLDDQGRTLTVEHDGTMVTVGLKGKFVAGLLAESPSEFFGVMFNGPVRFESDASRTVIGMVIDFKGAEWRARRVTTK